MKEEVMNRKRHIENRLSRMGAKVVKATEMSFSAKKLCEEANKTLLEVQTEVADLYEMFDNILENPKGDQ